jgi:hypothetical protein
LYGTSGTDLVQFYEDDNLEIDAVVRTALMPMGDPIRDKQALKIGVEASLGNVGAAVLQVTIDSEANSSPTILLSNGIIWLNNSGNYVNWLNNSGNPIIWGSSATAGTGGYFLYKSDAQMYGKYIGMTINSNTRPITINGFQYEHELRARF